MTSHPWRHTDWIEHKPRASDETMTLPDDRVGSGRGTGWPCDDHTLEQIGGKRCVRCCTTKDLSYVWRKPAGGSPGAFRWLCSACQIVYRCLGLIGKRRIHVVPA